MIKEQIKKLDSIPVEGLTSLMQEFDVPMSSRKKLSQTLKNVYCANGGPLDVAYESERVLGLNTPPEDFFYRAIEIMEKEPGIQRESRRILVSRRQIRLFLKEALSPSTSPVLSEGELNEIAPLIGRIAAGLGPKMTGKIGDMLAKGASGISKKIASDPKLQQTVMSLIDKSADKLPQLKQYVDAAGIDLENPDFGKISDMLSNDKLKGELDKVFKQGSQQMDKAEECDCPTAEEMEKAGQE